jgi:hypothetical protein
MDYAIFALIVILVLAHTAETILGFGATIIAFTLAAHLFPVKELVVILVFVALIQSMWLLSRSLHAINWRILLSRILPFALLGMIGGIAIRTSVPEALVKKILGLFVVVLASIELTRLLRRRTATPDTLHEATAGAFLIGGGIFHGLFATGGPLIVYHTNRQLQGQDAIRGTLAVVWIVLNIGMVLSFLFTKQITSVLLWQTLLILPGVAVGIAIGHWLKIDDFIFKTVTYSLLLCTGALLLLRT